MILTYTIWCVQVFSEQTAEGIKFGTPNRFLKRKTEISTAMSQRHHTFCDFFYRKIDLTHTGKIIAKNVKLKYLQKIDKMFLVSNNL